MWIRWNPNPLRDGEPDCVIRAICGATWRSWHDVFWDLCSLAAEKCTMPSSNWLWGLQAFPAPGKLSGMCNRQSFL